MQEIFKLGVSAFGVPAATWLGIDAYWLSLRASGEAPAYHVAAMVGLRGLLAGPMQLLAMVMLALAALCSS